MAFKIKKKAPRKVPSHNASSSTPPWQEDPDVRRWVDWAISLIEPAKWAVRRTALEAFRKNLYRRHHQSVPIDFNYPVVPDDRAGWYLYQAELYLVNPYDYDLAQGCRILPVVNRLGNRLDEILRIPGSVERMQRALTYEGADIDSALFELTVASVYSSRGFTDVAFVPESPQRKTPDLKMLRQGKEFYAECKRKRKTTDYARKERERWWIISAPLRKKLADEKIPAVVDIVFHVPVLDCPDDFLDRRVVPLMKVANYGTIIDNNELRVIVKPIHLDETRETLRTTMIRIDSTLLYEKLYGPFERWRGHTGLGIYQPSRTNPRYITDVTFAASCIWSCDAPKAMSAKAQHFKRELAAAVDQLPSGIPSAVHLGFEAYDGEGVEAIRYERLKEEMMADFKPTGGKLLETVYCHLFQFESTPTENWAVNETCSFWLKNESSKPYVLDPLLILAEK